MPTVVGIKFKDVTKMYFFDPGQYQDLTKNDPVVVETSVGEELGWVIMPPSAVSDDKIKGTLKTVVRRATSVDLAMLEEYRQRGPIALAKCREKAADLDLRMKVIKAEYSFDGQRLLFSFTSEERIDFRELVRVLARSFKTRIEMKQIGARDEAKLTGGFGRCGRPLCCSSWLTEFHPVSIKMAKQQDLPLAPTEISGVCGRLLCCLSYENKQYAEIKQAMPRVGSQVTTPEGKGRIVGLNILTESVMVELQSELMVEVRVADLEVSSEDKPADQPRQNRGRQR